MHQPVSIQNPYMDGWYASMPELDGTREPKDNPHPEGTIEHYDWEKGYQHGIEEDEDNDSL